ncbi:hypothetical protein NHH03_07950 [Stieleria sp. TO1_6]|uniref:hypothetical protein n=1 Tax=Stieleria tagensis TaxID=2956795 RepID=UPI00209B8A85|nr:hypothetical protein [Stieleria tagensis]MCO8121664.1 hypothetical protein [Stieleria tagensis]
MALRTIDVPSSIKKFDLSDSAESLIDLANDRIEAFMLADQTVLENFVTCDFHLLDQTLTWIRENHLMTGDRFCELGSGFGVAAMLAALQGMQAVGIETEPVLVSQSSDLADDQQNTAKFYCGSFIPPEFELQSENAADAEHLRTEDVDVYEAHGFSMADFDLFFAYPWPNEYPFFNELFQANAADGALLLTYRGREGMNLVRKT